MNKTSTPRAAKHRAGKMDQGLARVEVWAYPEDKPAIKQHAAGLRRKREAKKGAKNA